MRRALALAARARGATSPNPLVGAVVVRAGRIVGEGYHRRAGSPHAEIHALTAAGRSARGASLYVTLEPCSPFPKRTPPCSEAILSAGVRRVVIAMADPHPRVRGRSIRRLRRAGIDVTVGPLAAEARRLNEAYVWWVTTGRPFVTLKIASTLDGKIATAAGDSHWITGPQARSYTHRLRSEVDAVLVGIGTVLIDDPRLTARGSARSRNPHRIIVDERLAVPLDARALRRRDDSVTYVATTAAAPAARRRRLEAMGVTVLITASEGRWVDLDDLIRQLGRRGITSVLIEGGAEINASALRAGLVRKVIVMMAPRLLGGRDAVSAIGGASPRRVNEALALRTHTVRRCGPDLILEGYL